MNSQLATVQERLQLASDARAEEIATGKIAYSGTVDFDALTEESINKITNDLYREGMMYYGKTHRHPNSTFAYTTSSLMKLMSWDVYVAGSLPESNRHPGQRTVFSRRSDPYPNLLSAAVCKSVCCQIAGFLWRTSVTSSIQQ